MSGTAVEARPPAVDGTLHRRVRLGVGGAALAFYTYHCCPTVHWGDSGELIWAGQCLGIAHPPGHPLYSILAHLFTWLPVGAIAWRVNWMSAVFGTVTIVVVFDLAAETLRRIGSAARRATWCAAFAAAMLGLTAGLWEGSVVAETTSPHAAFMALLVWLVWRIAWVRPAGATLTHALGAAAALYGFSATNHVAGIFFLPALAVLLIGSCGRQVLRPKNVAVMFACAFAGLSLYAFLPLRSMQDPPLDWANPETLENFWWVVSAKQYQAVMAKPQAGSLAATQALAERGILIAQEWTWVGMGLVVVGLFVLARRAPLMVVYVLLALAALIALGLRSAFILAYFVPGLLLFAVALAAGAAGAWERAARVPQPVLAAAAAALLVWSGVAHADKGALRTDRGAEVYAKSLLDRLPPQSVLLSTHQASLFTTWCVQATEGYRTDVAVIQKLWLMGDGPLAEYMQQRHPDLKTLTFDELRVYEEQWGAEGPSQDLAMAAVLAANAGRRPLYLGIPEEPTEVRDYLAPDGAVLEMRLTPGPYVDDASLKRTRAYWKEWESRFEANPKLAREGLTGVLVNDLNNLGLFYEGLDAPQHAAWLYESAMRIAPAKASPLLNRGRLYAQAGEWDAAERLYEAAKDLEPRNPRVHVHVGRALEARGEFADAYKAYLTALAWNPHDVEALRRAGLLMFRAGELSEATNLLTWAVESDPTDIAAIRGLARVALARKDGRAAEQFVRRAQKLEPNDIQTLLLLAEYATATGQVDMARDALAAARKQDSALTAAHLADAPWAREVGIARDAS